ncbi:MAG: apolipoprotein N-acyltransferase [Terracidiphilus sp.]
MSRTAAPWAAAILAAGLLELPFPLAGPLPPWRSIFAWFGLVPLLWAILSPAAVAARHPLRRAFLLAYLCGVLWYIGNCYWIYNTMLMYGDLPRWVAALLLLGFSMVLGLYFAIFGWAVMLVRRKTGSARLALAAAPFFWVAVELAGARITSVPWDQLGYSQVDNAILTHLAPWTGVYGISFVLVAVNALIAGGYVLDRCRAKRAWGIAGVALALCGTAGIFLHPPKPAPTATAVLIQPNLNVGEDYNWNGPDWARHMAQFARQAGEDCGSYIAGVPQTGAPHGAIPCPQQPTHPDLVAWPESPAPFEQADPRLLPALGTIARSVQAPLVVGAIGMDFSTSDQSWHEYNSALIVGADGQLVGRYDKIHLVPFGEYVPFAKLLVFARKLTGRVSKFDRGTMRSTFLLNSPGEGGHRYGVFICYEDAFADEVRQFSRHGAQVLVNISDDGWYGDTSAPWQHLNIARMRAIENDRWLLRDTNNGITAAIDPYGRVTQSIPRHQVGALAAGFGFRDNFTFYTAHGDVFAWLCTIIALVSVGFALGRPIAVAAADDRLQ